MTRRSNPRRFDPRHEQLTEYVLGTLDSSRVTQVEAYLAHSSAAREEVRALRAALVALTETLPQRDPSPEVWRRIEATLEATPHTVPPAPARERERPLSRAPVRRAPSWLGWGFAAVFALLAGAQLAWTVQTGAAYRRALASEQAITAFLAQPTVGRVALQGPAEEALGSVLVEPDGDALFVLVAEPAAGSVYQAWGHRTDDWEPGSAVQLTSLGISDAAVFEVSPGGFASLYLSLEPAGGSAQPTRALAQVSVSGPLPSAPLELLSPEDGTTVSADSVIVSGRVGGTVSELFYRLNGGDAVPVAAAGTRFSFTVVGLEVGDNVIEVSARFGPQGLDERLNVRYTPPDEPQR